jgi:hypothetical protein
LLFLLSFIRCDASPIGILFSHPVAVPKKSYKQHHDVTEASEFTQTLNKAHDIYTQQLFSNSPPIRRDVPRHEETEETMSTQSLSSTKQPRVLVQKDGKLVRKEPVRKQASPPPPQRVMPRYEDETTETETTTDDRISSSHSMSQQDRTAKGMMHLGGGRGRMIDRDSPLQRNEREVLSPAGGGRGKLIETRKPRDEEERRRLEEVDKRRRAKDEEPRGREDGRRVDDEDLRRKAKDETARREEEIRRRRGS